MNNMLFVVFFYLPQDQGRACYLEMISSEVDGFKLTYDRSQATHFDSYDKAAIAVAVYRSVIDFNYTGSNKRHHIIINVERPSYLEKKLLPCLPSSW